MPSVVAAQMYTLREYTRTRQGLEESLKKLRDIGYTAVQFSAIGAMEGEQPEVTAEDAREMLDELDIQCVATHRPWPRLAEKTDEEIAFHKALGCNYVAIGGLPERYAERKAEGYRQFLKDSAPILARLKEAGIRFGYHNHAHEFQRIGPGRRTLYDIFIEEGSPDFTLEIDVYWAVHAGVNPIRLFDRCAGRVPVIHVKDKEVVQEGPTMAAVGEGNLDWDTILPAAVKAGVEVYAVEQDVCRRDPFDCLRSSFQFLSQYSL